MNTIIGSKARNFTVHQSFTKVMIKSHFYPRQSSTYLQIWKCLINSQKECSSISSVSCGSWAGRWKYSQQVVTGLCAWAQALFMWCHQPKTASCQDVNLKSCCGSRSSCLSPISIASPWHHLPLWRVSCKTSCVLPAVPLSWDWCVLSCNSRTMSEMGHSLQNLQNL